MTAPDKKVDVKEVLRKERVFSIALGEALKYSIPSMTAVAAGTYYLMKT
jgi:hypothetical protein